MRAFSRIGAAGAALLAAQARAQCFVSGGNFVIPDMGTLTRQLSCGSCGTIGTVVLQLRITHPRQGDLVIRLRHNLTGTAATLMNRPGTEDGQSTVGYTAANLGPNPGSIIFDDSAAGPYAVPPVGAYPRPGVTNISGSFRPTIDPLSTFAGLSALSTWTLEVSDAAPGMTGTLDLYSIRVDYPTPCYADCDHGGTVNVQDFACFLNYFAGGDTYANCDHSTVAPVLNVNDFMCFLTEFARCCDQ